MKKFLKILGIILVALIVIALIHTTRNYLIISRLQNKITEYSNSNNYHAKTVSTLGEGIPLYLDYYRKDNKSLQIMQRQTGEVVNTMKRFSDGKDVRTYIEAGDNKAVYVNGTDVLLYDKIYNQLETNNLSQKLLHSLVAIIFSDEIEGKSCYVISVPNNKLYIDKETGLLVKNIIQEQYVDYEFEFNNVDDSIFEEPDISEYTIQ